MVRRSDVLRLVFASLSLVVLVASVAQAGKGGPGPAPVKVAEVAPRPADVQTLDGIINAFYEVVSGPAGQPREWARDRTLYIPGIRFVIVVPRKEGKPEVEVQTHQEYVDSSDARMVKEGFFESEIHRDTKRFGNIVHVFSTYEVRKAKGGPVLGRGVNSIELFWDGSRWWIASATWEPETAVHPLPKDLLPAS